MQAECELLKGIVWDGNCIVREYAQDGSNRSVGSLGSSSQNSYSRYALHSHDYLDNFSVYLTTLGLRVRIETCQYLRRFFAIASN
jgi:hypothetical protein